VDRGESQVNETFNRESGEDAQLFVGDGNLVDGGYEGGGPQLLCT